MNKKEILKISIIILVTIIAGIIISVILFKPKNNIIESKTEEKQQGIKANINYYIDNNKVENMPNNGYKYVSSNCNNNASITFDENKWIYDISNVTIENTECHIYFENIIITKTLTFDYNGGTGTSLSKQVQVGFSYGTLPTPTYENHYFKGWYTAKTGGELVSSWTIMQNSDVTIYAQYEEYKSLIDILKKDTINNDNVEIKENIIRYNGSNPNNYVYVPGFGNCRIIGIFNNDIKVISEYAQTQERQWNSNDDKNDPDSNKWKLSDLYNYLNNEFYNGLNSQFKKTIKKHNWNIGKVSYEDNANSAYEKEQEEQLETYIGLMSASDYAYAGTEKCWNNKLSDYDDCRTKNWLYRKVEEWTLTAFNDSYKYALYVNKSGNIQDETVKTKLSYRIAFYLNDDLKIKNASTADGTSSNPYEIVY